MAAIKSEQTFKAVFFARLAAKKGVLNSTEFKAANEAAAKKAFKAQKKK